VRVIFITWRNEARRKEFSGGNTRREFIYKLILQVLKPSKSIEYGLEYFDSAISKVFAGTAKIVHFLHGPGQLFSYFREMLFKYVNCNNLFKLVDSLDDTVIVLDHVRAVSDDVEVYEFTKKITTHPYFPRLRWRIPLRT
jgi:hypothetical protein